MAVEGQACAVDGCDRQRRSRGWCSMHYQRWQSTGHPGGSEPSRSKNVGPCSVDGCAQPMRKRTWCAGHYAHWRRHGDATKPYRYRWATERKCVVCGATDFEKGRKVCSPRCQQRLARNNGAAPKRVTACARCGVSVDLYAVGKAGRKKRDDTKLCRKCKTMHVRRWMSPGELANRDGPDCGLCGAHVDLSLFAPDPMRASVDHIIPKSWGGSDEPSNLQLAHLHCNQIKSDRFAGLSARSRGEGG